MAHNGHFNLKLIASTEKLEIKMTIVHQIDLINIKWYLV